MGRRSSRRTPAWAPARPPASGRCSRLSGGDATTESNIFGHLLGLQLYAEHAFSRELDEEKLKKRFAFSTGCRYEDFWDINSVNALPTVDRHSDANTSRWLMWQDILMGLFDKNIEGLPLEKHYAALAAKMEANASRNGRFNFLFEYYAKVSAVLAVKSELGIRLRQAYLARDSNALKRISNETPQCRSSARRSATAPGSC